MVAEGSGRSGTRSHVLLAACRQDQSSFEEKGRGRFTNALLEILKRDGTDITYEDVINRLPNLGQ